MSDARKCDKCNELFEPVLGCVSMEISVKGKGEGEVYHEWGSVLICFSRVLLCCQNVTRIFIRQGWPASYLLTASVFLYFVPAALGSYYFPKLVEIETKLNYRSLDGKPHPRRCLMGTTRRLVALRLARNSP